MVEAASTMLRLAAVVVVVVIAIGKEDVVRRFRYQNRCKELKKAVKFGSLDFKVKD